MVNKKWFFLVALLAVVTGFRPLVFYFCDIYNKSVNNKLPIYIFKIGFYIHVLFAAMALIIGWLQFSFKLRQKNPRVHKIIGKLYIVFAIVGALSGIYISFYSIGGIVSVLGFTLLGTIWLHTTIMGYYYVKLGLIDWHKKMTFYSYAACFSGVTFRIWVPVLQIITHQFYIAYTISVWLCWIPNLVIAYLLIKNQQPNTSH